MAYRHFSLPSLKLTQRPTFGPKTLEVVQRTFLNPEAELDHPALEEGSASSPLHLAVDSDVDSDEWIPTAVPAPDIEEPTCRELESRASIARWEKIRNEMLSVVTEAAAMPLNQLCIICKTAVSSIRCQRCGPMGFFCPDCFQSCHSNTNLFHVAEKWEVCDV